MKPETARKSKQPGMQFIPALLLALLLPAAPVVAQEGGQSGGEQSAAEEPTKRTAAMGEKVYRKLAEAQAFTDVEPPDFASAMKALNELKASPKLSPYETAQLYNFYGFVYYAQERYTDSIGAYETVLKQPELPEALRSQTIYTLAQLHFTTEEWQKAIDLINQWLRTANNPGPDSYILLASAYYQLSSYQEMIAPVEKAMAVADERGTPTKEQWWLLLRVAYYELENYKKVTEILEVLVSNWPKKEYWTQLAAMYGELENEKRQLSAYESAYDQGFLVRGNELVQLAQLFLQAEVPYKAAQVMEKGFEQEQIEKTAQNYRSLSQAWQMAGDDKKAIAPLKSAAALSDDGILDVRLANSYLNLSRYDECTTAARAGINKGDLRRPDTAYEILGMCLFELDQYEDAKKAFRQAAKDDRTKSRARNWIAFIEKEQERLQQLEDSLKLVRRTES